MRSESGFALLQHIPKTPLEASVSGLIVGFNQAGKCFIPVGDTQVIPSEDLLGQVQGVSFCLNFLASEVAGYGTRGAELGFDAVDVFHDSNIARFQ